MPTYEYSCTACGHAFERFHSMTAAPIKKCPSCGKSKVKRLIGTGAGLLFKGSGFYITDYRSDSYNKAAKSDTTSTGDAKPASTESSASAPAKAETKSESPAPKPDPKPSKPAKKSKD